MKPELNNKLPLAGFLPAVVLLGGLVGRLWIQPTERTELERPLEDFPVEVVNYRATDTLSIPEAQLAVLDPDVYLVREYRRPNDEQFELFVAYYGQQLRGSTIHSPRNCLPGGGWEPVRHDRVPVGTGRDTSKVNRYVIQNAGGQRALVYYWYQGRGRIEASEYTVKWDLVRDAVSRRRTDEALVRLVFPLPPLDENDPDSDALPDRTDVAGAVAASLWRFLPDA